MPTLYKLAPSSSASLLPPLRSTPNSAAWFPTSSSATLPLRRLHSRGGISASNNPVPRVDPVPQPHFDFCLRALERRLDVKDGAFWIDSWVISSDVNGRPLSHECNKAMDELINLRHSVWTVYDRLNHYFRTRTRLKGLAGFFGKSQLREWIDVERLLGYQALRGGEPNRLTVPLPVTDFCRVGKTTELKAMEIAQSLEKLSYDKLLTLLIEARSSGDSMMEFFLEFEFLDEQVEVMKNISGYVAELEMVGEDDGGLRRFDRALFDGYCYPARYIDSD